MASTHRKPTIMKSADEVEYSDAWSVVEGLYTPPAILAAYDLGLFEALESGPQTADELSDNLGIPARSVRTLVLACIAYKIILIEGPNYRLSEMARNYFLESGKNSLCAYLSLVIRHHALLSFDAIKKAFEGVTGPIQNGDPGRNGRDDDLPDVVHSFTRAMHSASVPVAAAWPEEIDLSQHRSMLDIGGGSGAHSIAAATRWPELKVTLFDRPEVCKVAAEFASKYQLEDRISIVAGDMWTANWPSADLHFLSNVCNNYDAETNLQLLSRSYQQLPPGGEVFIHQTLLTDGDIPSLAASSDVIMHLWTAQGRQYSGSELEQILKQAGFDETEVVPTFDCFGIALGRKL